MADWLRINVVYSTQHWIFPKITICILIFLGAIILVIEGRVRAKAGKSVISFSGKFFEENYDKVKFWGTIALLAAYFALLDVIGFTVCSILFLFLFNTLFGGKQGLTPKYMLTSVIISVVSTVVISIMFGTVFNITLPSGLCTIWIKSMGITIF